MCHTAYMLFISMLCIFHLFLTHANTLSVGWCWGHKYKYHISYPLQIDGILLHRIWWYKKIRIFLSRWLVFLSLFLLVPLSVVCCCCCCCCFIILFIESENAEIRYNIPYRAATFTQISGKNFMNSNEPKCKGNTINCVSCNVIKPILANFFQLFSTYFLMQREFSTRKLTNMHAYGIWTEIGIKMAALIQHKH